MSQEQNARKIKTVVSNTSQVWQISSIWKNFELSKFELCRLPLLCG
jgi:hypothetical protein